jgi:hypothetical protein
MNRRTGSVFISLILCFFLSLLSGYPTTSAGQQPTITYSGTAIGAKGNNTVNSTLQNFDVDDISIPSTGGSPSLSRLSDGIAGGCIGNCDGNHPEGGGNGISLSITAANNDSSSSATVDFVTVTVGRYLIESDWLMPMAEASCPTGGSPTAGGSSSILWLRVFLLDGTPVYSETTGNSTPNYVVPGLPSDLAITVNEVITSQTSTSAEATVNALHITSPGAADFVVASVHADVHCGTAPANSGCTLTQGYYKNHESVTTSLIAGMGGTLSLGAQNYTASEVIALLRSSSGGDASLILCKQLIAAKLNIAGGAGTPTDVANAIADADNLLSQFSGKLPYGVSTTSTVGQQMVADGNILDGYNNGLSSGGPTHCD